MAIDYKMLINGKLESSSNVIDVINPATGEVFAQAPDCSSEQLDSAVAAAKAAFPAWRDTPIEERAELLVKFGEAVAPFTEELIPLFTKEVGRPLDASAMEVSMFPTWFQSISQMRPPVHTITEDPQSELVETRYVPLGVVAALVPWNFPMNIAAGKIGPALLTGNTVVLKPSPFTPLCTLKIAEIVKDILPPGVINIISGGDQLGPMLTAHPGINKISFTGSSATGKRVMATAAQDLKRVTLELGGNDAAIVMPDVDIEAVAQKIFMGAFFNTSQICTATKRLYVHEDVYDALRDALVGIAKMTKVGNGLEEGVHLGPIQNKNQYQRVMNLLEDAKQQGLTVLQGADVPDQGYFVPLTIIDNPPEASRVVQEEAFGPILPMLKFSDIDDVIQRANDSDYGLAGSIWSKDVDKARDIARKIETGTMWVNMNLYMRPDAPFAGFKQSGLGVECGLEGLLEFMAPQTMFVAKES